MRTLFLLKMEGGIHFKNTNENFQLYMTELEQEWRTQATNVLPHLNPDL